MNLLALKVPLRSRDGSIRAYALIDREDAHLAELPWFMTKQGYVVRTDRSQGVQRTVRLHREVLALGHGDARECDHISGDKLDNRRANLRVVTRGQNMQNKRPYSNSTSRYRGVSWHTREQKWMAQVQLDGRNHHLGEFAVEEDAAAVARRFREAHMEFTNEARTVA